MPVAMRRTITTAGRMHNHPPATSPAQNSASFSGGRRPVLLVAIVGGYYAYWRMSRNNCRRASRHGPSEQRALGNEIAFVWCGICGFPFRFEARFQQPAIRSRAPRGDVEWSGAFLAAEMSPWNLRRIAVRSRRRSTMRPLRLPGDAVRMAPHRHGLAGEIDLHGNGAAARFHDGAAAARPDAARRRGAGQRRRDIMLAARDAADRLFNMPLGRVTLDLRNWCCPPARGC